MREREKQPSISHEDARILPSHSVTGGKGLITFRVSCWACEHRAEFDRLEDARWNAARHKLNGHTVEIKPIGYEIQKGTGVKE